MTNLLFIPDALSMNSALDSASGWQVPAAIASRCSVLKFSTKVLKERTSSSLDMENGGVYTPVPLMTILTITLSMVYWRKQKNDKTDALYADFG
jgi:hypothetical protein